MKKYIFIALTALFSACSDYDDINTNIYGVTDDELKAGGLAYGASFLKMQQLVIPIGSPDKTTSAGNDLQNTDLISSGNYIGYFGNNNNWGFNIEASWNFVSNRMNYAYENLYSNLFKSWNEIYKETSKSDKPADKEVQAMADIVKIAAWLRATDAFGPIVYSQAGDGSVAPKLNSQEEVYRSMLADLKTSSSILKKQPGAVMAKFDAIYGGDTSKWVKFANSLILRMAVRVHFKDTELAKEYISFALDLQNGGVIESPADEARIQSSSILPLKNSMMASVEEYGETRMGATIWSYLAGYDDPRIGKFFTAGTYQNQTGYYPIAPTNNRSKEDEKAINGQFFAAKPKVADSDPLFWFRASEVLFLKAEAALFNLTSGDAKTFYEDGIAMSFEENGVGGFDSYKKSKKYPKDIKYPEYIYGSYSFSISEKNVSPSWSAMNDKSSLSEQEQKLQKIITQKYIALYPNALEAWTEYRRTGYPFIMGPFDQNAPKRIGADANCLAPERFKFSPKEYSGNPENMKEVPALLGGSDEGATKLWWVRDNRPTQR